MKTVPKRMKFTVYFQAGEKATIEAENIYVVARQVFPYGTDKLPVAIVTVQFAETYIDPDRRLGIWEPIQPYNPDDGVSLAKA